MLSGCVTNDIFARKNGKVERRCRRLLICNVHICKLMQWLQSLITNSAHQRSLASRVPSGTPQVRVVRRGGGPQQLCRFVYPFSLLSQTFKEQSRTVTGNENYQHRLVDVLKRRCEHASHIKRHVHVHKLPAGERREMWEFDSNFDICLSWSRYHKT